MLDAWTMGWTIPDGPRARFRTRSRGPGAETSPGARSRCDETRFFGGCKFSATGRFLVGKIKIMDSGQDEDSEAGEKKMRNS